MDHRPFEDWLLEQEPLTPQQVRELNTHLQSCPACSALAEVDLALHAVQQAEPAAGFVDRFQVRLSDHKQALRQRNRVGFFLLSLSVAGLLTALAWPLLRAMVASPLGLLAGWMTSLAELWATLLAIFHAGSVLFKVAPGFVPAYIWAILIFVFTGLSLVWVFSLIRFTRIRAAGV